MFWGSRTRKAGQVLLHFISILHLMLTAWPWEFQTQTEWRFPEQGSCWGNSNY